MAEVFSRDCWRQADTTLNRLKLKFRVVGFGKNRRRGEGKEMDTGVIFRILVLIGVAFLLFVPTLWAIRDVAYRSFSTNKAKVVWFVVVTLLPPLGGLVYIAVGRHQAIIEVEEPEDQEVDAEVEQDETLMK